MWQPASQRRCEIQYAGARCRWVLQTDSRLSLGLARASPSVERESETVGRGSTSSSIDRPSTAVGPAPGRRVSALARASGDADGEARLARSRSLVSRGSPSFPAAGRLARPRSGLRAAASLGVRARPCGGGCRCPAARGSEPQPGRRTRADGGDTPRRRPARQEYTVYWLSVSRRSPLTDAYLSSERVLSVPSVRLRVSHLQSSVVLTSERRSPFRFRSVSASLSCHHSYESSPVAAPPPARPHAHRCLTL